MNKILNTILILPLVGSFLLGSCGDPLAVAEGGIGGTGISTGTVTGIGSIKVNGVTFNTDNAAIHVEGVRVDDPADPTDGTGAFLLAEGFSEGQVVRVVGRFNADGKTGTADAVYYNDSVEGPVENITSLDAATQQDATSLRIQVMGQQVIIDNQTILNGTTIAGISINDLVEISGLRDEAGQIRAGYLEYHGSFSIGNAVELKGVIDALSLNLVDQTFTINGLLIDYTTAELPSSGIQEGMQVEVKGNYDGNLVDALTIEQEDDIDGSDNDEVEYEGIVSDTSMFSASGRFNLGNEVIQTTSSTIYKGGLASDIIEGMRLEVEGRWQAGTLIAEEIRFHDEIELHARVANVLTVTSESVTFDLTNLAEITVQVTNLSKISEDANDLATLADRLTNSGTNTNPDYVEVRGRLLSGSGTAVVFAEEIKIKDGSNENKVKLQGPVASIIEPEVTILGIDIDTTNIGEFEGPEDTQITREIFFATVLPGNILGAEGVLSGSTIDWDSIELEDEE